MKIPLMGITTGMMGEGGGPRTLLTDSFDRADNANTLGTADSGQTWAVQDVRYKKLGISSNKAYMSEPDANCAWVADLGVSNIDMRCSITLGDNSANRKAGLVARGISATNYIWASLIKLSTGTTTIRIELRANNVQTYASVSSPALTNGETYNVRLVVIGKEIQFIINNTLAVSKTLTDEQYGFVGTSGTKHGICFGQSDQASRIDDITGATVAKLPFEYSVLETRAYSSSIDEISNLSMVMVHPQGQTNLPIVALMHGWSGDASSFGNATLQRIADHGLFVISVGMRGRNGAAGSADASGREIYDIYDAIQDVRTRYPSLVSSTQAAIVGYSGGGGNALAAACKFPDLFNVAVSHYGMSDYGRNNPDGWYYNNGGGYTAGIVAWIGDTPANTPNNYYARDATAAIANYSGGHLYLYHDDQDATVPSVHSDRIGTAMDGAGLTNYTKSITTTTDDPRWTHGYPTIGDPGVSSIQAEPTWAAKILSQAAWTIPATGTVTVIGYIVTKRFTIWLNAGLDAAATVAYNTTTGAYTVTPLTSADITVAITQGALTASGTATAGGPTVFTVA